MELEEVIHLRKTGLVDMDGNELFDGDIVENFNIPENYGDRVGPIQLAHLGKYTFWSAAGASIQTCSADKKFGVRKIRGG